MSVSKISENSTVSVIALGRRISAYRKKMHLSQQQLAERLNIQRQTLSNYERGEREPSIYMLARLASIFSVTIDLLVRGTFQ